MTAGKKGKTKMKKCIVLLAIFILFGLAACNEDAADDFVNVSTTQNVANPDAELPLPFSLPGQENENYREAIAEFLSGMTTVFTGVPREEADWTGDERVPTGRFILGWDSENGRLITTYEVPEIYFSDIYMGGFFNRQGEQILDAPWMYNRITDDWASLYYASSFKLFDFNDSGIPDIFVHFNQTFDGGYAGFYRIFRYVDGEYKMLEIKAFENGVERPHPWLGSSHTLFRDGDGRLVTFIHSMYHGISKYEHLVLTDEFAELHLILEMDFDDWEAWEAHHWVDWSDGLGTDSWLVNNPTIFDTDASLTVVEPLRRLQDEIIALYHSR